MKKIHSLLAAVFAAVLWSLQSQYDSKSFGFHDVGLINDFFASTIYGRRLFWVNDLSINHLAWHFTPSFFTLAPLYRIFDSQFVLFGWSTLAFAAFCLILTRIANELLPSLDLSAKSQKIRTLIIALFAITMALGPFSLRVLYSGHYESFYLPFASLTLGYLIQQRSLFLVLPMYLLALGTREDAGLFLSFQMISLLFLPIRWIRDRRFLLRRVVPLSTIAGLWTVVAVKVVFPYLGMDEHWHAQRLWGHLGQSFGQIGFHLMTHPWVLFQETWNSAFAQLNGSVLFLSFVNPFVGVINNLPGLIFYTTQSPERKELLYYTSAFLLPGIFLSTLAGIDSLSRAHLSNPRGWRRWVAPCVLTIGLIWTSMEIARFTHRLFDYDTVAVRRGRAQSHAISQFLKRCPSQGALAADFKTFVLLPNPNPKFLLRHYRQADLVIVDPAQTAFMSGFDQLELMIADIRANTDYRELRTPDVSSAGLLTFERKNIHCRSTVLP